jgi:hypothetical protein
MKEVKPKAKGFSAFEKQSLKDKEILQKFMEKEYVLKSASTRSRLTDHAVMVSGMYSVSLEALNKCNGEKKILSYQAACSFLASMEALGIITIN